MAKRSLFLVVRFHKPPRDSRALHSQPRFFTQRRAKYRAASQVDREPAKAKADIEDSVARFEQQLCRDVAFFGELRGFEAQPVAFEIGTLRA
jgi:hypothetical protein